MSEAVERGIISKFEEVLICRASVLALTKVKHMIDDDLFTNLTEEDGIIAEKVISKAFDNLYSSVLKDEGIEVSLYQTNYVEHTNGSLEIISALYHVTLKGERAKKIAGVEEIDITDMIEGTKGLGHHILSDKLLRQGRNPTIYRRR